MWIQLLILATAIMAGVYFSFSVFVMQALAKRPALDAAKAMNSINVVIVKTAFLPLFFGSTLAHLVLLVWSLWQGYSGQYAILAVAALQYIGGMFLVTVLGNVPMNNELERREEDEQQLVDYWQHYLKRWTMLNHIRTVACILSAGLMLLAIA